jgi:DNA-binding response OmpR family regulator
MRVLIVDDEPELADFIGRAVRDATWAPDCVATGAQALDALAVNSYDLVVLDVGLPDLDGFEVCRRYRRGGGATPILMLTARDALGDRVHGLDAGADDYLTKPFALDELLARLRALARRPPATLDVVLRYANVELDPARRVASRDRRELKFTAREFALLEYLMRTPERALTRSQILEHVWDDQLDPEGTAPLIHTLRGLGYILSTHPPGNAA